MAERSEPLIVVIDDEQIVRESLSEILRLRGYAVVTFDSAESALDSKLHTTAACFISDLRLPGMDGVAFLEATLAANASGPVIIMTGHGDVSSAVEAMRKGAYDFFEKPFEKDVMLASVARAVEKNELLRQAERLNAELLKSRETVADGMRGESEALAQVRESIAAFADTGATVLISGETGSGKELVARALHDQSSRRKQKFVGVNLASLPESLAMGELFGHERGAYTGADSRRVGKFEYASGGTLLLDEINSAPQSVQVGVLRAIEERAITRLGGNDLIPVDTRIIASTNKNLLTLSRDGGFREDLYHRLSVAVIDIPPLRERLDDIPALTAYFLRESTAFYEKGELDIAPKVVQQMRSYTWPGNIRELKNCIATMVLTCRGDTIEQWRQPGRSGETATSMGLKQNVENFERNFLTSLLRQTKGNLKTAATLMEIPQRSLFDKMRKYSIDKDNFK